MSNMYARVKVDPKLYGDGAQGFLKTNIESFLFLYRHSFRRFISLPSNKFLFSIGCIFQSVRYIFHRKTSRAVRKSRYGHYQVLG